MWTATLDLSPRRVLLTRLLGRFWRNAYFSSVAPLTVANLPRQALPSANWVRVKNYLAGICGSDLHLVYADVDHRIAPAAIPGHAKSFPGHEVVGEVVEVGSQVQNLQVGDRVVYQYGLNCLTAELPPCSACSSGFFNVCQRGSFPEPLPSGGGWSEEMLVHETQLYRLGDDLSNEQAVMLEPTAVALHGVLRHLPRPGEKVMVVGAGTIGLLTLQIVRALVPDAEISVLAKHSFQVEQATRLGAQHLIYPRNRYAGVKQATNAQSFQRLGNKMLLGGYDVIYDTIGQSQTLHDSLRWARPRSTVVMIGLDLHMHKLDLSPVWYQEVNLFGTMSHSTEHWPIGSQQQRSSFSVAHELINSGQVTPEKLITHRYAITDYRTAIRMSMKKGSSNALKVLFDHSLVPPSVVPQQSGPQRQNIPMRSATVPAPTLAPQQNLTPVSTTGFPPAVVAKKPNIPALAPIPTQAPPPSKPVVHIIATETPSAIPEADVAALPAVPFDKSLLASAPNPDRLSAQRDEEEAEEDTATSIPIVRVAKTASPLPASLPTTPAPPALEKTVFAAPEQSKKFPQEQEDKAKSSSRPPVAIEEFPTLIQQPAAIEEFPTLIQQSPVQQPSAEIDPLPYWLDQSAEATPEWLRQLDPQNMPALEKSEEAAESPEPVSNETTPPAPEVPPQETTPTRQSKKKRNR